MTRKRLSQKRRAEIFLAHGGICYRCKTKIMGPEYDLDHVTALFLNGADEAENLAPVHPLCHRGVGGKTSEDARKIAKVRRILKKADGVKSRHVMPGSRRSAWKKPMNGKAERR